MVLTKGLLILINEHYKAQDSVGEIDTESLSSQG